MKKIIVIPARYASSRLPGKPLMDIAGKPMIWWVYNQCKKVNGIDDVIVATDDERIITACNVLNIKSIITSEKHENHVLRVAEVSTKVDADYYICVNGDEPLIDYINIEGVIPQEIYAGIYAGYCIRKLTDISEAADISNIKVVRKLNGDAMYLSRTLIPYPKGGTSVTYYKLIGIECFNKEALNYYANTPMSYLEKIEDIDHLRFLENDVPIHTTEITSESISVDTHKDLEYVRKILGHE